MKRDKGKAMKMKAFFLTFVSWMEQQQAEAQPRIAPSLAPGRPRPLEPQLGHTGAAPRLILVSFNLFGTSKMIPVKFAPWNFLMSFK